MTQQRSHLLFIRRIVRQCAILLLAGFFGLAQAASTCNPNIPASTPAFTDNGDGTVTDPRTGLMWKRCAEGLSGPACATGAAASYTWQGALQQAVLATDAGHADWRLPNIKELRSLVEEKCITPSINETYFPNTPASSFWSGSPSAGSSGYAWYVVFDYGDANYYGKDGAFSVRLVRGGQSFDSFYAQQKASQTIGAITFAPATLAIGSTTTVSATATSGLPVGYTSTTTGVCTVSGSTVTGVTAGTCTIAANQAGNASYNAATQVTQSITVSTSGTASISNARVFAYAEANDPGLFSGTVTAGQYQQYDYRYYLDNRIYLAIDTTGMIYIMGPTTGGAITAVGTVASFANLITAWEATVKSFTITPANSSVAVGATVQLTATATDQLGRPFSLSPNLQWTSYDPSTGGTSFVATVSSSGLVTAKAAGTTTIQVTDPVLNWSTSAQVTVTSGGSTLPAGYVSQGGLTWMPVSSTYYTYAQATALCAGTINGQTGWRLPTLAELSGLTTPPASLVTATGGLYGSGAMNGQGWTLSGTWSSTPYSTGNHYAVSLYDGNLGWNGDTVYFYVTCVR